HLIEARLAGHAHRRWHVNRERRPADVLQLGDHDAARKTAQPVVAKPRHDMQLRRLGLQRVRRHLWSAQADHAASSMIVARAAASRHLRQSPLLAPGRSGGVEQRCSWFEQTEIMSGEDALPLAAVLEYVDAAVTRQWRTHEVARAVLES